MGKMSAEEMGILFAGISSILATLIYFTKNLKESECCGARCKQTVLDGHGDPVRSSVNCFDEALTTVPPTQIPAPTPVPAPRPPRQAHPLSAVI
jgi:hypothetical protein